MGNTIQQNVTEQDASSADLGATSRRNRTDSNSLKKRIRNYTTIVSTEGGVRQGWRVEAN